MQGHMNGHSGENGDTQLDAIRDLMLAAGRRGAWLTLEEIAGLTEIGEASVSAQLRHLRKREHGGYAVEKRRRMSRRPLSATAPLAGHGTADATRWEYRVSAPVRLAEGEGEAGWTGRQNEGGRDAEARA